MNKRLFDLEKKSKAIFVTRSSLGLLSFIRLSIIDIGIKKLSLLKKLKQDFKLLNKSPFAVFSVIALNSIKNFVIFNEGSAKVNPM